jgi:hypothetical protein
MITSKLQFLCELPRALGCDGALKVPLSEHRRCDPRGLIGASLVAASRGRCRRIGVSWGSQVVSGMAGAYFTNVSARLRFGRYRVKSGGSEGTHFRSE